MVLTAYRAPLGFIGLSGAPRQFLGKIPGRLSVCATSALRCPPRFSMSATQERAKALVNSDIERGCPGARFNQYAVHGGVCYLSGQVARGTADGSARLQTRAILEKIDGLLEMAGTSKSRLLSCTVWLSNISRDVAEMNEEWDAWVDKDNMPVRATTEARLVDDEITVEIQATAAMPTPPRAQAVATSKAAAAVGPYNQAVKMRDGTVYVSGCIGLTTAGEFAGPTVEEQTTQALANLDAISEECGENTQIVKTTILLDDMDDFAKVNKIYETFFSGRIEGETCVPARACFTAAKLPKGALVEVEAIAITE